MAGPSDVNTRTTDNRIYGEHDVFTTEGCVRSPESDLHRDARCKKYPGHTDFIRFKDFTMEHLPENLRQEDLFEFMKLTGELTVCVTVKCTSEKRPALYPKSRKPYPFGDFKGTTKTMRMGTGRIFRIYLHTRQSTEAEICQYCSKTLEPNEQHVSGTIFVNTATHVVFDTDEAKETKCYLFFDKNSPIDLNVHIEGLRVIKNGLTSDLCKLVCRRTCDENLLNALDVKLNKWKDLRHTILEKYTAMDRSSRFAFIVSHPHGFPKMVTIGRWTHRIKVDDDPDNAHTELSQFVYTTPTCPGSSGACVMLLGCSSSMFDHVHGGFMNRSVGNDEVELRGNFSGVGRDYLSTLKYTQEKWLQAQSIDPSVISDPFAYFKT